MDRLLSVTKLWWTIDTATPLKEQLTMFAAIISPSKSVVHNSAKHGGAIFAVESFVLISTNNDHLTPSNSIFTQAGVVIVNNTGTVTGGGVYLYYRLVIWDGRCHLTGNDALERGRGIHAVHSYIKLEPCDMCKDNLLVL